MIAARPAFGYSPRLMQRVFCAAGVLLALGLMPAAAAMDAPAGSVPAAASPHVAAPDPSAARDFVSSIRPSPALQSLLDRAVADIARSDPKLLASAPRIAVIDLRVPRAPALAQIRGDEQVYPASVVKFVYLMAAYAWQQQGRLRIDPALDTELTAMIRESSNRATQKVFSRLTDTQPGPELAPAEYAQFRERRLAVKRWLVSLGITDLHAVNPTYDGGGDLFGRDEQFLRDRSIEGGLPAAGGKFSNRQSMTAAGTARLLALLAADRALTPADSQAVRNRMRRDLRKQPYLARRIAGGAAASAGVEAFSKSGTWGPIYADAGIVRDASGKQFVLAFFTEASSPYRGDAIATLTRRLAAHLFTAAPAAEGDPP